MYRGGIDDLLYAGITADDVLRRVSEEEIVFRILGFYPQIGVLIRSPFRADRHPTCSFDYYRGRLRFVDWANPPSIGIWDIVIQAVPTVHTYRDAVLYVAKTLNTQSLPVNPQIIKDMRARPDREPLVMRVKFREFSKGDRKYLSSFGITRSICNKFQVKPIQYVWKGDYPLPIYGYDEKDPCLGYYHGMKEGIEQWKLYFYRRTRDSGRPRFLGNTNEIFGWKQLPDSGSHVVLTKSGKDVMSLYRFGVTAIALQGEGMMPKEEQIDNLRSRFSRILSLYDRDRTGMRTAQKLRREFAIEPILMPKNTEKDFSDYRRTYGHETTSIVVEETFNRLEIQPNFMHHNTK